MSNKEAYDALTPELFLASQGDYATIATHLGISSWKAREWCIRKRLVAPYAGRVADALATLTPELFEEERQDVAAVAKRLGVSPRRVKLWCKHNGISAAKSPRRTATYTSIMEMRQSGMTLQEIGEKFGITRQAVHSFIQSYEAKPQKVAELPPLLTPRQEAFHRAYSQLTQELVDAHGGNREKVAEILGIQENTLREWCFQKGVSLRRQGAKSASITPEVYAAYNGHVASIAKALGVSDTLVGTWRKANVPGYKRKEAISKEAVEAELRRNDTLKATAAVLGVTVSGLALAMQRLGVTKKLLRKGRAKKRKRSSDKKL